MQTMQVLFSIRSLINTETKKMHLLPYAPAAQPFKSKSTKYLNYVKHIYKIIQSELYTQLHCIAHIH